MEFSETTRRHYHVIIAIAVDIAYEADEVTPARKQRLSIREPRDPVAKAFRSRVESMKTQRAAIAENRDAATSHAKTDRTFRKLDDRRLGHGGKERITIRERARRPLQLQLETTPAKDEQLETTIDIEIGERDAIRTADDSERPSAKRGDIPRSGNNERSEREREENGERESRPQRHPVLHPRPYPHRCRHPCPYSYP
jgi:hypothetical protein